MKSGTIASWQVLHRVRECAALRSTSRSEISTRPSVRRSRSRQHQAGAHVSIAVASYGMHHPPAVAHRTYASLAWQQVRANREKRSGKNAHRLCMMPTRRTCAVAGPAVNIFFFSRACPSLLPAAFPSPSPLGPLLPPPPHLQRSCVLPELQRWPASQQQL